MEALMAKSHSLSIFLLKSDFDADNALIDRHGLQKVDDATNLPDNSVLYIGDNVPKPPWWKNYFGITKELRQSLKSALLFVQHDHKWFALSFGHAYSKLDDNSYEYDFGVRVTLNSIDPEKLNSIDSVQPSTGKRQRTQVPNPSEITLFDFDRDSSILRNITGRVEDKYKGIFKNPSGASSLRVKSQITAENIPDLLKKIFELYKLETYKETFPNLLNITPIKDPEIIAALDEKLLDAMKSKSDNLYLTIPEIIDYEKVDNYRFISRRESQIFDDIYLDNYYRHLNNIHEDINDIDIDGLKKQKIALTEKNTSSNDRKFSLYKCLVFDTKLEDGDGAYHLNEGNWYKIKNEYLNELQNFLDSKCRNTTLPHFAHQNENAYNKAVAADQNIICLDRKDIAPRGQTQIEPCDLYSVDNGEALFIHVKRSTKAASISHLLAQGVNSAEALRGFDESLTKLHELINNDVNNDNNKVPASRGDKFLVCFAIITHKDISKKSENLPLFSRITAMRNFKHLEMMNIDAWFEFIPDERSANTK